MSDTVVLDNSGELVTLETTEVAVVDVGKTEIIVLGGLPGVAGPPGASTQLEQTLAAAQFPAFAGIRADSTPGNYPLMGISTGPATQGSIAEVRTQGYADNILWTLTPNMPVFVLTDGQLTQVVPTSGMLVVVGYAVTPTRIFVCIQPPIQLG